MERRNNHEIGDHHKEGQSEGFGHTSQKPLQQSARSLATLEQVDRKGVNHAGRTGHGNRFWNGKENSLRLDPHRLAIRALKILSGKIAYLQAWKSLLNCLHDLTVDQLARLPGPKE
ncbi:MAG: hypothetical protein ABSA01_02960 [Anaerolineales bacterium]